MSESTTKPLREGSTAKRAAILSAARSLFIEDGFDRSSVDAVAALAGVSKRTVYDYFGDKLTLFRAVTEQAVEGLMLSLDTAIETHLTDVDDLEAALVAFSYSISTATIGSSDYSALMRLVSLQPDAVGELKDKFSETAPEAALAVRFTELGRLGLLDVPDPLLAVDHFTALTFAPGLANLTHPGDRTDAQLRSSILEGVRVFLRAYTPR